MKVPHNFKEIKRPRPPVPFNKVSHTHPGGGHPLKDSKFFRRKPILKKRKRKM